MNHAERVLSKLDEGYIFTGKDTTVDFDKWLSGENPVLFVVGLSGAGKSSLTKTLADKYNAKHVHLGFADVGYNYKKAAAYYKRMAASGKRIVIDGWQPLILYAKLGKPWMEWMKTQSFLFLRTSSVTASSRILKRDFGRGVAKGFKNLYRMPLNLRIQWLSNDVRKKRFKAGGDIRPADEVVSQEEVMATIKQAKAAGLVKIQQEPDFIQKKKGA